MKIEYKVRPVTRYVVTRYESDGQSGSCGTIGEFDNERKAKDVARALASEEIRYLPADCGIDFKFPE